MDVYVSLHGKDTKTCGSQSLPCQSIAQAVYRVGHGGNIYLDGRGTEKRPYGCRKGRNILMDHPGIYVNNSLTVRGFYSTPHVLCTEGFHFQKTNGEKQTFALVLSGVDFQQTPLNWNDFQSITINNCSFHNASRALAIKIQNITSFQLNVKGNSTFRNNSQCINVLLLNHTEGNLKIQHVTLKIKDTMFERNGLYWHGTGRDVIKISSVAKKGSSPVYFHIFCHRVENSYNEGPFLDLNVSNAITNETFLHVDLHHNEKGPKAKNRRLYFSHARETKAKFISLTCHDNQKKQCIVVQSDRANIVIQDSIFYNQSVDSEKSGSCLSLAASIIASLRIVNSNFHNNEAGAGGSIFANSKHGLLKVDLTNVTFSKCKAARYGCVISIGRTAQGPPQSHWGPHRLYFTLRNVTVQQWEGNHRNETERCIGVDVVLDGGIVTLEGSTFTKKMSRGNGAFSLVTTGGKTNISISNCTFKDTSMDKSRGKIVYIVSGNGNAGMVTISNSFIENRGKRKVALFISPRYHIKLFNVTFNSLKYGLQTVSSPPKNGSFPIDILIDKCSFIDNTHDAMFTLLGPTSVQLTIKNTLFSTRNETVKLDQSDHGYAISFVIPPLNHVNFSGSNST